jgi:RNA polymerase sigma-70 factor, ECF subfamily
MFQGMSGKDGSAERATFASLLDGVLPRSYRLAAVILCSEDEAQDATHDAALRAWRNFRSLRDPTRFEAWFARILVNVCRDRLAGRSRRVVEIPMAGLGPIGRPESFETRTSEVDCLRTAITGLTPEHRLVVALRYLEDLTVDEIARRTGTRPGTVKSRLHYALADLRAAYQATESRREVP